MALAAGAAALLAVGSMRPAGAAPHRSAQSSCEGPALVVGTSESHELQLGFIGLGAHRLREVRIYSVSARDAVIRPDSELVWHARSASEQGINPVLITAPAPPDGMATAVAPKAPLPDRVGVIVALLEPSGERTTLAKDVDLGALRAQPSRPASVTIGCGEDPFRQLGAVGRALALGAALFVLGVLVLLLVLDGLLAVVRRLVQGPSR